MGWQTCSGYKYSEEDFVWCPQVHHPWWDKAAGIWDLRAPAGMQQHRGRASRRAHQHPPQSPVLPWLQQQEGQDCHPPHWRTGWPGEPWHHSVGTRRGERRGDGPERSAGPVSTHILSARVSSLCFVSASIFSILSVPCIRSQQSWVWEALCHLENSPGVFFTGAALEEAHDVIVYHIQTKDLHTPYEQIAKWKRSELTLMTPVVWAGVLWCSSCLNRSISMLLDVFLPG